MKSGAYYNEIDKYAAQWLRNLIKAGLIAPGDVDERSIEDVKPNELLGYKQCHFFAGVGVWSHALRNAGWSDDQEVWTGSCPCQPFSTAGKGVGFDDQRHLWPHFHYLIEQCQPLRIFGEQVASKDGLSWLDLVLSDLEATGYTTGAVDFCAAGVGAPHIRQRLYWMVDAFEQRSEQTRYPTKRLQFTDGSSFIGLADSFNTGSQRRVYGGSYEKRQNQHGHARRGGTTGDASSTNGFWRDADWLFCRDGKWRPVEPGTFPLANGATSRVGRLCAYGNAIVAQCAEEIIRAYMDIGL